MTLSGFPKATDAGDSMAFQFCRQQKSTSIIRTEQCVTYRNTGGS